MREGEGSDWSVCLSLAVAISMKLIPEIFVRLWVGALAGLFVAMAMSLLVEGIVSGVCHAFTFPSPQALEVAEERAVAIVLWTIFGSTLLLSLCLGHIEVGEKTQRAVKGALLGAIFAVLVTYGLAASRGELRQPKWTKQTAFVLGSTVIAPVFCLVGALIGVWSNSMNPINK